MLGIAIDEIDFCALTRFLETGVREGFALDFKREFPSNLEKTLAAFANTYGGIVLIGVDEDKTGAAKLPMRGVELKPGLRERVLQIAMDAVYPPLVPEVRVVPFKSSDAVPEPDRAVVVVRVHESDSAPHAVDGQSAVYLRVDNVSDRLKRATIGELEWLLNKREKSSQEKFRLLARVRERAKELRARRRSRHSTVSGTTYARDGAMTLLTIPTFPRAPMVDTRTLLSLVQQSELNIPAAPHKLPDGQLQRIAGGVAFHGGYSFSEFQQQGLISHEVDYFWDYYGHAVSPGARQLLPGVTAALLWGSLELSRRMYRDMGYSGLIDFQFRADGLKDAFFADSGSSSIYGPSKLVESEIIVERRFSWPELESNLLTIAQSCQRELYWAFGFDVNNDRLEHDFKSCQVNG